MDKGNRNMPIQERPVTLRDFVPGQEVYALHEERGRNTEDKIDKMIVVSVGRTYVKATLDDPAWPTKYYLKDSGHVYLTESKDWGYQQKLFPNRQAVDEYCQKKELYTELRHRFNYGQNYFSLKQLRVVKDILDSPIESYISVMSKECEPEYLGENTAIGCRSGRCECGNIVRSYQNFCDECGVKLKWGNVRM